MRNVAYFFIIIALIIAGFMIMFRYQTGPRVEISVQQALPKVLIALLLITFSYAIGGFLLDIGVVLKNLIQYLFENNFSGARAKGLPIDPTIWQVAVYGGLFDIKASIAGAWSVLDVGIISAVVLLIMRIVEIFIAFYLFFMLIFRFAGLFVYLIFSPLAFLWGSVPGQQDTTTKWFKMFLVNVLVFPIVYFLFNLSLYIRILPNITMPDFGIVHSFASTRINSLIAFGVVLAATKVPAFLEDALDVVPSGHVSKAGVDVGKSTKKIPIIGGLLG